MPRGGPPPGFGDRERMMDQLKEPKPKTLKDVPQYLKHVLHDTFFRLFYIIRLVWEAKRSLLLLMAVMALFNGVSPVISAFISANLLNEVSDVLTRGIRTLSDLASHLLPAMLLQFGYMFLVSVINSVSNMTTRLSGELVTNHVKMKMMDKAKEIDVASFDMPEFYARLENASRETDSGLVNVISSSFSIVSTLISTVSFIVILAAVAWFAPLVVILLSLPSAIITFTYRKKNFRYMFHHSRERRQMSYYSDTLTDKDLVKEMRLFHLSDVFIFNYTRVFEKYFGGLRHLILEEGIWSIATTLVTTSVNCALFFFITYTVATGNGRIGDYSLYTGALTSIASCVATLVTTTSTIYERTLFIDNLIVFLNEKRHIVPSLPEPAQVRRHIGHTIEFQNVSFRYPGTERDVIHQLSFRADPGETIVLVGQNGAGKTTLLKLLTRLYDPTEGKILLDGRDMREYDVDQVYAMFGAIFQDFGKYAFKVSENISFGQADQPIDETAIRAAAVSSTADEFIQRFPEGYDTPLMRYFEADGIEPSIGQWQKLAVARAFYSDSDVMILDEPTASLDALAEQEIFNQFDRLGENKTVFFVSHRLSSATMATKILVLDQGRLVESGRHEELMAERGLYYKLFSTQASRYLVKDAGRDPDGIPHLPDRDDRPIPPEMPGDGRRFAHQNKTK